MSLFISHIQQWWGGVAGDETLSWGWMGAPGCLFCFLRGSSLARVRSALERWQQRRRLRLKSSVWGTGAEWVGVLPAPIFRLLPVFS